MYLKRMVIYSLSISRFKVGVVEENWDGGWGGGGRGDLGMGSGDGRGELGMGGGGGRGELGMGVLITAFC